MTHKNDQAFFLCNASSIAGDYTFVQLKKVMTLMQGHQLRGNPGDKVLMNLSFGHDGVPLTGGAGYLRRMAWMTLSSS
jgi:hypothetical protein